MTSPFTTPGELSEFDQGLAAASTRLDRMVTAVRSQVTRHGDEQATCNTALTVSKLPPRTAGMLLTVALRRLTVALRRLALQDPAEPG